MPVSDRRHIRRSYTIRYTIRVSAQPLARKLLILKNGEMSEWLKEHAWKACVGETLPWVRIPLSANLRSPDLWRATVGKPRQASSREGCPTSSPADGPPDHRHNLVQIERTSQHLDDALLASCQLARLRCIRARQHEGNVFERRGRAQVIHERPVPVVGRNEVVQECRRLVPVPRRRGDPACPSAIRRCAR